MTPSLPRIQVLNDATGRRLDLTWETGERTIIDLGEYIARGGIFRQLNDPKIFATAKLDDRHRVIEWHDPKHPRTVLADMDADTLLHLARQQGMLKRLSEILQRNSDPVS